MAKSKREQENTQYQQYVEDLFGALEEPKIKPKQLAIT